VEFKNGKRLYSRWEVAEHDRVTDGWVVIEDKVYNVTTWIPLHPGGEQILLDFLGKDATRPFKAEDHGVLAYEQLTYLHIGYIREARRYTADTGNPHPREHGAPGTFFY